MPDLSILWSPAPYHILCYGTLLGSTIDQTFINGIIAYQVLPRPQFSTLQKAIFPIYFALQTALPTLLALTYPGLPNRISPMGGTSEATPSGLRGVLEPRNRWSVLLPLATMFVLNATNLVYVGPETTRIMKERKHQETRDGRKFYDKGPHSEAMRRLNARFGKMHGISAMTNLVSLGVMVWYGFLLAERFQ